MDHRDCESCFLQLCHVTVCLCLRQVSLNLKHCQPFDLWTICPWGVQWKQQVPSV